MAKIAHLTSVHTVFDTRIFYKECLSLAAAGHEVHLIAPADKDTEASNIRIHAVRRPLRRSDRVRSTIWQVLRAAIKLDAEVYHFHDPELITVGMALKLRGKKVIFDVHENVPEDILSKAYIPRALRVPTSALASLAQRVGAACFDLVITATPAIAAAFSKEKTVVVQNFPVESEIAVPDRAPYQGREQMLAYIGVISAIRGTRDMVEAMARLPDALSARLVVAGSFSPASYQAEVEQFPGWNRVEFWGQRSRKEVIELLGNVRAGLVLFHPVPNHINAQPNKLFEYMAAGIPVIASDFPLWREIIYGAQCGILVDPTDVDAIASAIERILANPEEAERMGANGIHAVQTKFNWASESTHLLAAYERVLGLGSP